MKVNKILNQISFKGNEIPEDLKRKGRKGDRFIPEEAGVLLNNKNKINYIA